MKLPEIGFGKKVYCETEGQNTFVHSYNEVCEADIKDYKKSLEDYGYILKEEYNKAGNSFAVFVDGEDMVFLAYYPNIGVMRVISEPQCEFLKFADTPRPQSVESQLTHIDLEDFGLSYVIRLSDGRFIIFDGGYVDTDEDKLMKCLDEQTPHEKPIIAGWIITHAHVDHYVCFIKFMDKYSDRVTLERIIHNLPDNQCENWKDIPAWSDEQDMTRYSRVFSIPCELGVPMIRVHSGQELTLGNARMEILSSLDDKLDPPMIGFNETSLIIRMTIEGQVILWTADAEFDKVALPERWGKYMKADIFQIPHHGFLFDCSKESFELVDPEVCITAIDEETCFKTINYFMFEENRHLIHNMNVKDYYTGSCGNFTLKLPYTPRSNGREILHDTMEKWHKGMGARNWYFDDMTKENCKFTFLNSTIINVEVFADLYFEDPKYNVKGIKVTLPSSRLTKADLFNPDEADGDALIFNRQSLKKLGVPDGVSFTVSFKSTVPVIIKGEKAPVYYG